MFRTLKRLPLALAFLFTVAFFVVTISKTKIADASSSFNNLNPLVVFFQSSGVAPSGAPGGGFEVEGNLDANFPTANTSDWTPRGIGSGIGVLSAAGVPVNPAKTFHSIDVYKNDTDNVFAAGMKANDDPNNWKWKSAKADVGSDINNGLLHISNDGTGDLWVTMAADRASNEGDTYLDFEFLQNTLTVNNDGSFTSNGTEGGRTVGDLQITIALFNNRKQPEIYARRWQKIDLGTTEAEAAQAFDWVELVLSTKSTFVAANNRSTTPVSFGAFGSMTYPVNTFGEAAVNIHDLIAKYGSCLNLKTLLIKSKTSELPTAALMDFLDPIQLNLTTLPVVSVNSPTVCQGSSAQVTATIISGKAPFKYNWIGPDGFTATTQSISVRNPGTYSVTVTDLNNCTTNPVSGVVTINPAATVNAGTDQSLCAANPVAQLAGAIGGAAISANWSGGAGTFSPNANALNATYTPTAAEISAGLVVLTLTTNNPTGPCPSVSDQVVIRFSRAATANAGGDKTVCASNPSVRLSGSIGGSATSGTWSGGSGTFNPNANTLNATYTPSAAEIAAGSVTLVLTTNDPSGACGAASDRMTITIGASATVNAGTDISICGSNPVVQLNGTIGGSATGASWSGGAGTFSPNANALNAKYTPTAGEISAGSVTLALTAASACGSINDTVKITFSPGASANAGSDQTVCSLSPVVQLAGSIGGATSGTWSGGGGTFNPNANSLNATYTPSAAEIAAGSVTLTLNATGGGCGTASDQMKITINTAATVNAGADQSVCAVNPQIQLTGSIGGSASGATWSGGGGSFSPNANALNATYTPSAAEVAAGTVTLTLTTNDPAGPCGAASDSVTFAIASAPSTTITMPEAVCSETAGYFASVPSAGSGATYNWTINNGTINTGQGTPSISWTPGNSGTTALSVVVAKPSGCSATGSAQIAINESVAVNAGNDQTKCLTSGSPTVFTVIGSVSSGSAQWNVVGTTGSASASIISPNLIATNVNVSGVGTVTLRLSASGAQQTCGSSTDDVVLTVNQCAPPVGPGIAFPATAETSDQKAGSVLIYNVYTSNPTSPQTQNTRISLTNIHQQDTIAVHMFFIDGASCSVADSFICLTRNQTTTFFVSDYDPGTTGFLVAVAVDLTTGCPTPFNYLIGDEYVKFSSGHQANLQAESIAAIPTGPFTCNETSPIATINFDGISYNRLPRALALDDLPSRADGNDTMLIVNRIGGNLGLGTSSLGPIFGLLYNDQENGYSFSFNAGCQIVTALSSNFPRTVPRLDQIVPAGRSGWLKLWMSGDNGNKGIMGAAINANPNAAISAMAYNQGRNLHKLTFDTTNSFIIPVFPPPCR